MVEWWLLANDLLNRIGWFSPLILGIALWWILLAVSGSVRTSQDGLQQLLLLPPKNQNILSLRGILHEWCAPNGLWVAVGVPMLSLEPMLSGRSIPHMSPGDSQSEVVGHIPPRKMVFVVKLRDERGMAAMG